MTIEEKAHAYDVALARAKGMYESRDDAELAAYIFPELTESEDERIREWLITQLQNNYKGNYWATQAIAYLEKQKEPQNKSMAHEDCSWPGITSPLCKDKNLDDIAQEYVEGVKEYNPTPDWNLIHTAVCYGYHLAEQKEQKPVEGVCSSKGRRGRIGDTPKDIRERAEKFRDGMEAPYDADDICSAYESGAMDERKKPVGWSEEDKRVIRDACCWIAEYAGFLMSENKDKAEMLWKLSEKLKSLRPQQKEEWTEEDEKKLKRLCWIVLSIRVKGLITEEEETELGKWMDKWLNHNPVPRWKPSEHQLSMLKAVIRDPNNAGSESCSLALQSLYEDLRNYKP